MCVWKRERERRGGGVKIRIQLTSCRNTSRNARSPLNLLILKHRRVRSKQSPDPDPNSIPTLTPGPTFGPGPGPGIGPTHPERIPPPKTIPRNRNPLNAQLLPDILHGRGDARVHDIWVVEGEELLEGPAWLVEVCGGGGAGEEVGG